jgi:hypothetical protein
MIIDEWTNFNYERNESNVFVSNDQSFVILKFKELIDKFL